MGHTACSSTMLFVVSYGIHPIFIQSMNFNFTFWYFNYGYPSKIGLGPPGQQLETPRPPKTMPMMDDAQTMIV